MIDYPVHYFVSRPLRFTRVQLVARIVAFCALGVVGISFGTIFLFAYLALPVLAAIRLGSQGSDSYLADDGPRLVGALRWFAAVCAWAGLVADHVPGREPADMVQVRMTPRAGMSSRTAIWRVVTGIPSAFVLAVLGCIASLVWLWAAVSVAVTERVGQTAFRYLAGIQRWSIRLLAYQASLVDEYPPFSFGDTEAPTLPTAQATP